MFLKSVYIMAHAPHKYILIMVYYISKRSLIFVNLTETHCECFKFLFIYFYFFLSSLFCLFVLFGVFFARKSYHEKDIHKRNHDKFSLFGFFIKYNS